MNQIFKLTNFLYQRILFKKKKLWFFCFFFFFLLLKEFIVHFEYVYYVSMLAKWNLFIGIYLNFSKHLCVCGNCFDYIRNDNLTWISLHHKFFIAIQLYVYVTSTRRNGMEKRIIQNDWQKKV